MCILYYAMAHESVGTTDGILYVKCLQHFLDHVFEHLVPALFWEGACGSFRRGALREEVSCYGVGLGK